MVLLAVVGIVLLIACSNVANLLLARSAARRQEISVRLAIGASRQRLLRQLLTESLLLACLGGALGLLVGYVGFHLLFSALPAAANFVTPKFDLTVLAFSLAVSLATGFLFGIIPAFQASSTSVAESLKRKHALLDGAAESSRSPTPCWWAKSRFRFYCWSPPRSSCAASSGRTAPTRASRLPAWRSS